MKINEIITEAPVGMFKQGLRKFGARALSALGAKGAAMNIAGKVDVGDKANDLFNKFNSYLGTQGRNINAATANDVIEFLDNQGLEAGITPSDNVMPKQAIEQEFLNAAQASFKLGSRNSSSSATAAPTSTKSSPQAKSVSKTVRPSTDTYDKFKGEIRRLQPTTGAKVLPQQYADQLQSSITKLAKGDKESGIFAADKILKFAKAGYDVAKLAQQWQGMARQGERFLTQSVYREITAMLAEHGLRWADLGLRVRIVEGIEDGVFISQKLNTSSLDIVL